MSRSYFVHTFAVLNAPVLALQFSKDIAAMPGADGDYAKGVKEVNPYLLVIDKSGYFDVVSYLYTDTDVRHFTNGDVPRSETEFVAWALLPDMTGAPIG